MQAQQESSRVIHIDYYMLINNAGDTIIPPRYNEMKALFENRIFVSKRFDEHGASIVDSTGKTIIPCANKIQYVSDNLLIISKQGRFGLINDKNKILIPVEYTRLQHWKKNLFIAQKVINNHYAWGVINSKNEIIIPFKFDNLTPYTEPLAGNIAEAPYYFALLDEKGRETKPFGEARKNFFSVSDGMIVGDNNSIVAFDLQGNCIIPKEKKYQWLSPFADGYAFFQNKEKLWGIVDKNGTEVIPAQYNYISTRYRNMHSQPVIEMPETFVDGVVCVSKGYIYGAVDKLGYEVIPFEYNSLRSFSNGLFIAYNGTHYGIINKKNECVLPFEYSEIQQSENGYASVKKNGLCGVVNPQGKLIMSCEYYYIEAVNNSLFIVKLKPKHLKHYLER